MIAMAAVLALTAQSDPAAFATACMAGGGAPGMVEAISDRDVARDIVLAQGTEPVSVTLTIHRASPRPWVYAYADGHSTGRLNAGGSIVLTGRRIHLMTGEDQTLQYCLRLQRP